LKILIVIILLSSCGKSVSYSEEGKIWECFDYFGLYWSATKYKELINANKACGVRYND